MQKLQFDGVNAAQGKCWSNKITKKNGELLSVFMLQRGMLPYSAIRDNELCSGLRVQEFKSSN